MVELATGSVEADPPCGTGTSDPVRRLHLRVPLDALGELTRDDDLLIAVVTDLSAGGARLRLHDTASSRFFGEGWTISSPIFGRLPVYIRWRRLDEAGVSFPIPRDRRIALDRLVRTLLRHGAGLSAEGAQPRFFASGR